MFVCLFLSHRLVAFTATSGRQLTSGRELTANRRRDAGKKCLSQKWHVISRHVIVVVAAAAVSHDACQVNIHMSSGVTVTKQTAIHNSPSLKSVCVPRLRPHFESWWPKKVLRLATWPRLHYLLSLLLILIRTFDIAELMMCEGNVGLSVWQLSSGNALLLLL